MFSKRKTITFYNRKKKPNCDLNLEKSEAENKSTLTFTWFHEIPCDNREHGINMYMRVIQTKHNHKKTPP